MTFKHFIGVLLIFSFNFLSSQETVTAVPIKFQGSISDDKGDVGNAVVQITKAGRAFSNAMTNASGEYSFEVPQGSEYMVTVSKEGYVSKRFYISTLGIPAE